MLWYTHLVFGLFSGLVMIPFNSGNKILFLIIVMLGSLLPDIDTPKSKINSYVPWLTKPIGFLSKHRSVFHSLIGALVISGILFYFTRPYGIALFIGYCSHLVIDGITKKGVNFLHPVSRLHLSGFVETGKLVEHIILIGLVVGILLRLF